MSGAEELDWVCMVQLTLLKCTVLAINPIQATWEHLWQLQLDLAVKRIDQDLVTRRIQEGIIVVLNRTS